MKGFTLEFEINSVQNQKLIFYFIDVEKHYYKGHTMYTDRCYTNPTYK